MTTPTTETSPDRTERINDFLARHGGAGSKAPRAEETAPGVQGWSEVYASDGYILRCEWSRFGSSEDMKYSEIPPR
jgi:hypothetical protein